MVPSVQKDDFWVGNVVGLKGWQDQDSIFLTTHVISISILIDNSNEFIISPCAK